MKVRLRQVDSLLHELDDVQRRVAARAHDLFQRRGGAWGRALDDWISAEREVAWSPPVDVVSQGSELRVVVAAPGVEPAAFDVRVSPADIVVTAPPAHLHDDGAAVHVRELPSAGLSRHIRLPARIAPDTARADYRNGVLRITASVAPDESRHVEVLASAPAATPTPVDVEC